MSDLEESNEKYGDLYEDYNKLKNKDEVGFWGGWDSPYLDWNTWKHLSQWDIRHWGTIATVIVVCGVIYYTYTKIE